MSFLVLLAESTYWRMELKEDEGLVFESLKEHRGKYFVEYCPARGGDLFASLTLTFPQSLDELDVIKAMENECLRWIERFPISLYVTSCDGADDEISLDKWRGSSCLFGLWDGNTVRLDWGEVRNDDFVQGQLSEAYLNTIYAELSHTTFDERRKSAIRTARRTYWYIRIPLILWLIVTLIFCFVDRISQTLGIMVSIFSGLWALYKYLKVIGKIPPSKAEREKQDIQLRKEHYFYHCERNTDGFNRLMVENLSKEAVLHVQKEEADLLAKQRDSSRECS